MSESVGDYIATMTCMAFVLCYEDNNWLSVSWSAVSGTTWCQTKWNVRNKREEIGASQF